MKLKAPAAPSLGRKTRGLNPKVEIVIACEGKNTEPEYFRDCVKGYGAGMVKLRVLNETGVPLTVVRAAIDERNALIAKRRKSPNSFDACFRVWAVFDRDEHPNFADAVQLAIENKIDLAYSNPCFEIWPLLHIENYGCQDGRHSVQKKLEGCMTGYRHDKGARIDFDSIKDSFQTAYDRAKLLRASREQENDPFGCPSTTVSELVRKIIENGKGGFVKR